MTYADGKITPYSPDEAGVLYIFSKADGVISTQKAYPIAAGAETAYDIAVGETAYFWSTVLEPICDPFTVTE